MTSPQDLDTRVRQHHDEIIAIYELLEKTDEKVDKIAEVQQEHGSTLGSILQTLEGRETSLSLQSERLSSTKHSMKRLEDIQRKQAKRLDGHGEKLDEILGLLQQGR